MEDQDGEDDLALPGGEEIGTSGVREPLVQSIIAALADDIISGRLPPDADLNSVDLARRFDTSRTPIREALLHLSREGLVDIAAGKRPRVSSFSEHDIRQFNAVRSALFKLAAELLAQEPPAGTLARLDSFEVELRGALQGGDAALLATELIRGIDLVADICGNAVLTEAMRSLRARTHRLLRFASLRGVPDLEPRAWDSFRLFRAIREGDAPLAGALAESLVRRTDLWLGKALSQPVASPKSAR